MNSTYELMQDADNIAEQACPCAGGADYSAVRNIVSRHVDAIEQEVADGYMKLPVDEDGEVWHIGDMVEWCDGTTAEVIAIGGNTLYYIDDGEDNVDWTLGTDKHHHHGPTVKSVLAEFAERLYKKPLFLNKDSVFFDEGHFQEVVDEFAEKFQLADDAAGHMEGK